MEALAVLSRRGHLGYAMLGVAMLLLCPLAVLIALLLYCPLCCGCAALLVATGLLCRRLAEAAPVLHARAVAAVDDDFRRKASTLANTTIILIGSLVAVAIWITIAYHSATEVVALTASVGAVTLALRARRSANRGAPRPAKKEHRESHQWKRVTVTA